MSLGVGGTGIVHLNNSAITLSRHLFAGDWNSTAYTPTSVGLAGPGGATATYYNTNTLDDSFGGISMRATNGASTNQQAYIGVVANNAGNTPDIVIGQQTGATSYQESLRIDSAGNVGIGTAAPVDKLHVWSGDAGAVSAVDDADDFVVENSGNAGISILSPDANWAGLYLGSPSDATGGGIEWNQSSGELGIWAAGAGFMNFSTNGSTKMLIDNAGNVGIGTTTPAVALDVNTGSINAAEICDENNTNCIDISAGVGSGDINQNGNSFGSNMVIGTNDANDLAFERNNSVVMTMDTVSLYGAGGTGSAAVMMGGAGGAAQATYGFLSDDDTGMFRAGADELGFTTGGNEALRIDSTGSIGIGTDTPDSKFHLYSAGILAQTIEAQGNLASLSTPVIRLRRARDSAGSRAAASSGDLLGSIAFQGYGATGYTVTGSSAVAAYATENFTDAAQGTNLVFGTTPNGSVTKLERVRIDENGYVGINNTSPNVELDVTGDIEFTGTITDVSDRRLKEDIMPLENSLDKVLALQGVSFVMKGDESRRVEIGVIAQEVEKVMPELVKVADDEMQTRSVNYIGFIGYIIEAIKELRESVFGKLQEQDRAIASVKHSSDNNSSEIDKLKSENQELKSELDAVKKQNQEMNERLKRIEELLLKK